MEPRPASPRHGLEAHGDKANPSRTGVPPNMLNVYCSTTAESKVSFANVHLHMPYGLSRQPASRFFFKQGWFTLFALTLSSFFSFFCNTSWRPIACSVGLCYLRDFLMPCKIDTYVAKSRPASLCSDLI